MMATLVGNAGAVSTEPRHGLTLARMVDASAQAARLRAKLLRAELALTEAEGRATGARPRARPVPQAVPQAAGDVWHGPLVAPAAVPGC